MSFEAKDAGVQGRQHKVQRLCIPFKVVHSTTAASVVLSSVEPSIIFMQSNGVNQITAADSAGALLFTTQSPTDASGQLNFLLKLGEVCQKVECAYIVSRTDGTFKACYKDAASAQGASVAGNVMLYAPTGVNFTTTDLDASLIVEYVVAGSGN